MEVNISVKPYMKSHFSLVINTMYIIRQKIKGMKLIFKKIKNALYSYGCDLSKGLVQ